MPSLMKPITRCIKFHRWASARTFAILIVLTLLLTLLLLLKSEQYDRPFAAGAITHYYSGNCSSKEITAEHPNLDRRWPKLELMLPLATTKKTLREFTQLFLPSYALFWPVKQAGTSLLVVMDEEEVTAGERGNQSAAKIVNEFFHAPCPASKLSFLPFRFSLNYLPRGDIGFQFMSGHSRQQWVEFWADNFTSANFIGFVDSDTVFATRVTLPDLFDGDSGHPIIRPLFGKPSNDWWAKVPQGSYNAIGKKEPFSCMTYFPVVLNVTHLPLVREHIRRHLNAKTFDDAFLSIISQGAYFSQFDIICTYLWWYQRDHYYWVIAERDPDWWGPAPDGQMESMDEAGILPLHRARHGPRLAVHWSYEAFSYNSEALAEIFRTGICYSTPEAKAGEELAAKCRKIFGSNSTGRKTSINKYEWTFEWHNLAYDSALCLKAHQSRLERNDKIEFKWEESLVKAAFSTYKT